MKVQSGMARNRKPRVRVQWAESCQAFVAESLDAPFERWALGATADEARMNLRHPDSESEVRELKALQQCLYDKLSRVTTWDRRAEQWHRSLLKVNEEICKVTFRKLQPVMMWEEMA